MGRSNFNLLVIWKLILRVMQGYNPHQTPIQSIALEKVSSHGMIAMNIHGYIVNKENKGLEIAQDDWILPIILKSIKEELPIWPG